jgi:hypothetical protein
VRDYFLRVSQSRPKSQLEHCPILHKSGDSRIGRPEFRGSQRTDLLGDRAVARPDNCVRHHRLRRRVSRRGNRNPECRSQESATDEICNPRNFDCASAAKERVPIWSGACAGNEHDSQNYLAISRFFEKAYPPLTYPLPTIGERRERRAANSVTCHHARFAVPLLAFQISEDREKRKAVLITALSRRMALVVRLFLSQRNMMKERDCFP